MADAVATKWETVIGLEVHAQLNTRSKMYCSCRVEQTTELADANRFVCPVCLGHPGTLPRPNRQAVIKALTLGEKLGCRINSVNVFARKNYFYPDLPKGYQISQYELPICEGGRLPYWHGELALEAGIVRAHLEEDTAKLFHMDDGTAALDYNRGGVGLIEIVSEPDFRSAEQCVSYLEELRNLLVKLGISDAAMESGNFRCEPNVSVRPVGSTELRTKTEIKNLNSFQTLRRAVEAEVLRQIAVYEGGGSVHQATMRFDDARGVTVEMRRKETADDYRYFADPDIPPLTISAELKEEASHLVSSSWFELRRLMVEEDGITHEAAQTIASDPILHRFYRNCSLDGHSPKEVANWVTGDFVRLLREGPLHTEPGELSAILALMKDGKLTRPQAREVFEEIYTSGKATSVVVEEKGFGADSGFDLEGACREVIARNTKIVDDILGGKETAINALLGQVMKASRGGANPADTTAMIRRLLKLDG
ncbi:MAG: Asp-tRNA(Asn)/Glu-tRNA(Gln) amidotransferase subunit GatB [bacterium]